MKLFMDNNLRILRGIDEKYVYELSRQTTDVDEYASVEELLADEELSKHNDVIIFAETWGIGYRRWKR